MPTNYKIWLYFRIFRTLFSIYFAALISYTYIIVCYNVRFGIRHSMFKHCVISTPNTKYSNAYYLLYLIVHESKWTHIDKYNILGEYFHFQCFFFFYLINIDLNIWGNCYWPNDKRVNRMLNAIFQNLPKYIKKKNLTTNAKTYSTY